MGHYRILALAGLLFLAGCQSPPEPEYDRTAFACTLAWETYTADCHMENGVFTMDITAPDTLQGLSLRFADNGCSLVCGELSIPLSENTAAGVVSFPTLLTADPATAMNTSENTLDFGTGKLILRDGLPVRLETEGGRWAEVLRFTAGETEEKTNRT